MSADCGLPAMAAFDGLDNRKVIVDCFRRMGGSLPEWQAAQVRALFLQKVVAKHSKTFGGVSIAVTPCSPEEAYTLFLQVCAHAGVPVEEGVLALEEAVR